MNNKLLVTVYVPNLEVNYDIYIPINKSVGVVKKLIINSIIELSYGLFKPTDKMKLYFKDSGVAVSENALVKETNIVNGDSLVIF